MKIENLTSEPLDMPMSEPLNISLGRIEEIQNVAVEVELENGIKGIGEGSPFPPVSGETREGALIAAQRAEKIVEGDHVENYRSIIDKVKSTFRNMPSSNLAVETAIIDAYCKHTEISMAEFFGSRPSPVTTDVTLGIDSLEKTRSKAKDAQKRGFGHIKLKTGNDIKQDLKRIEIVSTEIDNPCIKVDANQGWSPKETERFASRVKEAGVDLELIEQPVEANDLKGLKEAKRRVDVPIAADESVFCKEDALKVAGMRAADIINIKTGKTGLIESQQIVSIAEAAGLDLMIGCNIESRIGIHTAAHMVSGTGSFSYVDLDGAPIMSEGIKDSSHGPKINIQGPGHGEHDY